VTARLDDLSFDEVDSVGRAEDTDRNEPIVVGSSPEAWPGSQGSRHEPHFATRENGGDLAGRALPEDGPFSCLLLSEQ
jgi:hypothetical protein